jgi:hypothetical protein
MLVLGPPIEPWPPTEHLDDPGRHTGLLEHLALDRLHDRLVVLGVAARKLPPAAARLVAAPDQQHLAVADHDTAHPDREVAEVDEPAGIIRTGQPIAAALRLADQLPTAPGTELHDRLTSPNVLWPPGRALC